METKTVICPECNSSNFYSANDELIRCRACGANIHIQPGTEQEKEPEPENRIPENVFAPLEQPIASIGQRFTTYLVDQFITALIFLAVLTAGGGDMQTPDLSFYTAFMTVPFYYTLLEGSNGKTLGKILAGTRVVDANGNDIGYGTAFFRTLCRMIPFEVISIFFHNGRCWHDLITRTTVINDR